MNKASMCLIIITPKALLLEKEPDIIHLVMLKVCLIRKPHHDIFDAFRLAMRMYNFRLKKEDTRKKGLYLQLNGKLKEDN